MSLSEIRVDSPVGMLRLIASETAMRYVLWGDEDRLKIARTERRSNPILELASREIEIYFDGKLKEFSVPIEFQGSEFQIKVWEALTRIPYGETRSYSQLAVEIGSPNASRAVGLANGNNPLSIIVPCHRVVGKSGYLTGFAGGLESKALLLDLEWANRLT